jgi:hypothetical protein
MVILTKYKTNSIEKEGLKLSKYQITKSYSKEELNRINSCTKDISVDVASISYLTLNNVIVTLIERHL